MSLDEYAEAGLHGTTDYWGGYEYDSNYSDHKTCPACGVMITNDARYCHKHAKVAKSPKIQAQIARLIELADLARQREVDEIARRIVPRIARIED